MVRAVTDDDRWLFGEGRHQLLHEILGSHLDELGASFRVWAPNAASVSVVGDFNEWTADAHPLDSVGTGLWQSRVDGLRKGDTYK
jgi:1,4-alpha-glucan branching enzyme